MRLSSRRATSDAKIVSTGRQINVNFETQMNPFGVVQKACNLCGDCTSGCNQAAKNTTQMNYLPDAANHGANIFTHASVEYVEKADSGWVVHVRDPRAESAELRSVRAEIVILAAGALGSTELLLKSRDRGLALSSRLGKSFSGNGDVLGFGYNCYWRDKGTKQAPRSSAVDEDIDFEQFFAAFEGIMGGEDDSPSRAGPSRPTLMPDEIDRPDQINAIGVGDLDLPQSAYPGPCITGIIDLRDADRPEHRLVVEEGVIPGAIGMSLPGTFLFGSMLDGDFFKYGPNEGAQRLRDMEAFQDGLLGDGGGALETLETDCYEGATGRTQTYLVMSKDDASGELELGDTGRVRITWPAAGKHSVYARDNAILDAVTEGVHGQYIPNPLWSEALNRKLITVHPIGGCGHGGSRRQGGRRCRLPGVRGRRGRCT